MKDKGGPQTPIQKIAELKSELHFADPSCGGPGASRHTIFVDSDEEGTQMTFKLSLVCAGSVVHVDWDYLSIVCHFAAKVFDPLEYFDTDEVVIAHSYNRLRKSDLVAKSVVGAHNKEVVKVCNLQVFSRNLFAICSVFLKYFLTKLKSKAWLAPFELLLKFLQATWDVFCKLAQLLFQQALTLSLETVEKDRLCYWAST